MLEEIKVSIYTHPWNQQTNIAFFQYKNGKTYMAEPVELNFKERPDYEHIEKATLSLNHLYANSLLTALAEELDKNGIKTDKDAKIAGTLDATRYHLEDLRTLLKIKNDKR